MAFEKEDKDVFGTENDINKKNENEPAENEEISDMLDEVGEAELAQFNEALEKLSLDNIDMKAKLNSTISYDNDIDRELEELLKKELMADEVDEIPMDFVGGASMYSSGADGAGMMEEVDITHQSSQNDNDDISDLPEGSYNRKGFSNISAEVAGRLNSLPIRVFIIVLAALLLTILAAAYIMMSNISDMNAKAKEIEEQIDPDTNVVRVSMQAPSNSSYTYIKNTQMIGDKKVTLTKMAADRISTALYFDTYFDADAHNITLSDDKNNIYAMDKTFVSGSENNKKSNTILRFSPLSEGVEGFSLNIYAIESGNTTVYDVTFEKPLEYTPAKYLNESIYLDEKNQDLNAKIYSAEFSSSGSRLHFGFGTNEKGESLSFAENTTSALVEMEHLASKVLPTKLNPSLYLFNNGDSMIGRMDFSALKGLSGNVKVKFNNLYKDISVEKEIDVSKLMLNEDGVEMEIPAGGYKLVLERMGIRGDKCILVVHSETLPSGNGDRQEPERIEVRLDTELIIKNVDGRNIVLPGECLSIKEGSDIVYDITNIKDLILDVPPSDYRVNIKKAKFKIDEVAVNIDLDKASDGLSMAKAEALDSIRSAFNNRLAYKSNHAAETELKGFSKDILTNADLMKYYEPVANLTDAKYSTQILTYTIDGEELNAVVYELWRGTENNLITTFERNHKITANKTDMGWIIVKDVLVN